MNPFFAKNRIPYNLPDFRHITTQHFREAILTGIDKQKKVWEEISSSEDIPNVNILEELEISGQDLQQANLALSNVASNTDNQDLKDLESDLATLISKHFDSFWQNEIIYKKILRLKEQINKQRDQVCEEDLWIVSEYLKKFKRNGITCNPEEKSQLSNINMKISEKSVKFGQLVAKAIDDLNLRFKEKSLLQVPNLTIDFKLPTGQIDLANIPDPEIRREVHNASTDRGTGTDPTTDTRNILLEIVKIRAQRARLLGYKNHSEYVAEGNMAGSNKNIDSFLQSMIDPVLEMVNTEAKQLQRDFAAEGGKEEDFSASDWIYYAKKQAETDSSRVSDKEIRPYLELNTVLEKGIFYVAQILYGLSFTRRPDLAGHVPEALVWEVKDENNNPIGLFIGDYYTRPGKYGGAWMSNIVEGSNITGHKPVVTNNLNLVKPPAGEKTLLNLDELRTVFHEFGHAIHGLITTTKYPSLSGTRVPRDFVEFPSQVYEMWTENRMVLENMLRHYQTGIAAPTEIVERMIKPAQGGTGYHMTEMLGAVFLDQAWHRLSEHEVPEDPEQVINFEHQALAAKGIDLKLVPPRYRSTYYGHIFYGDYDAGYYSYLWAEAFDADAVAWFKEFPNGGLCSEAGKRFREEILSKGNGRDPLKSFMKLRGRNVDVNYLLQRHGLL